MLTDEEARELMFEGMEIDLPIKHPSKPYKMIPTDGSMTNGGVVKAMFPNADIKQGLSAIYVTYFKDYTAVFDFSWWNALYKAESEVEDE